MTKPKKNECIKPLFDTLDQFLELFKHNELALERSDLPYPADYKQALFFLYSYRGSEATFNAYRRELERFLQWSWFIKRQSIHTLNRLDIELFIEFCQNPPLDWIALQQAPRFIEKSGQRLPNPDWRPFLVSVSKRDYQADVASKRKDYRLSQQALQAIFSVLSSFYTYLVQEAYVDLNPVAQIRQKSKFIRQKKQQVVRRLTSLQWDYVIDTATRLADENPNVHERTLFIMSALYSMYLRVSELTATDRWLPQMGHFYKNHDNHWWFLTVGKGNKERTVSVSNAMLASLKRYRKHLGLSPLPALGETHPLLLKQRGKGPITSTRNIRLIVQYCFDKAIETLQADSLSEEAEQLKAATVHWLRHTGISDDVLSRPREHVRDDAGHSSGAITDRYIDVTSRERHASKRYQKMKLDEG